MNGNLCRCGTYVRIRQAIHKASEIATTSKLKKPSEVAAGQSGAQQ
jgi:aerobic-type carbon monoxide dehydrogenase small subunit (CoxS/CutS family)